MNLTGNKSQIDRNKIVIFGAGKIGRSFIGQLFGRNGYKVVFVDVDLALIGLLNSKGRYRIVIKGETDEEIIVPNVGAVSALDRYSVTEALSTAGIAAVSVGRNALEKVASAIGSALQKRYANDPDSPLDIILAENMRSAAEFVRDLLKQNLPAEFPVDTYVGLIETSIGKMVPIIPNAELEKDPLVVFAEPYNTLILDGKGFRNPIPQISGMAPKNNIKAWVDRKAFIHNLGHATAAYYGYSLFPDAVYMYEVLDHEKVARFTRDVMLQSADILAKAYPDDYSKEELTDHIDDLIYRFRNRALKDTLYRVGQDLRRKLGSDDRFMGAIHLAMQQRMPYDSIINAMSYGFSFRAKDEEGNCYPADVKFLDSVTENLEGTLTGQLGFDTVTDLPVIEKLLESVDLRSSGLR